MRPAFYGLNQAFFGLLLLGVLTILYVPSQAQTIRYVKQGGTGDGSSWANASGDLQAMINANGTQQVWVAKGTYSRTTGGSSFVLKNGVAIYGGFRGSETNLSERPGVNPVAGQVSSTTLTIPPGSTGSVIRNDNNGLSATAILDGVVITGGNAANNGGGMVNFNSSPSLTNCVFSGNLARIGGGMANGNNSSPSLTNCLLSGNSARIDGGGMDNTSNSNPSLTNCLLSTNSAGGNGGGMVNFNSSPSLTNCLLSTNSAGGNGGGMVNFNSSPSLTNCTLTANRASSGATLRNTNQSQTRLTNCILWDNQEATSASITNDSGGSTSADYSLIGAGETDFTGSNNLTATRSPFVSPTDYRLSACSIAIDKGDNAANTATTDLAGNPRIVRTIDIGAYEYQGSASQPVAITTQPASASSVQTGASVTVPVSVSGSVSSYQWYKDNLSNAVSGQTSATLSLANVQPSDGGSYSLVVSGACNSVTSTAFSLSVSALSQTIRYVRQGGTGDGSSWANASGDLQAMINANGTQQVWVAKGTYSRTTGGISFVLKNGVAIYGGFRGSETNLSERPGVNPVAGQVSSTTLTIPPGSTGSVIRNNGLSATAILDGVVVTGGNTDTGGGMFNFNSSPSLTNCVFSANSASFGGGIYNRSNSNPSLTNCVLSGNSASNDGGGIYNVNSSPSLTNCLIQNNSASNDGGGMLNGNSSPSLTNCVIQDNSANQGAGIANVSSSPTLLNCLLRGNTARGDGGALYNIQGSTPTLTNCTLTANRAGLSGAGSGAALRNNNTGTQARLTNCILWDNQEATSASITNDSGGSTSADYSLIGAGETDFTGSNNLTATRSPFVSPTDYRLSACSIAIDKGDNAANTATTDLAGNPRIVRTIDIGAYEYQGSASQPVAITTQPASASSVQTGASVTVPVSVSGSVSSYQWYKDNLSNAVSGQTSATLSLANVQPSDGGSYSLVVSGACNSVTSTAFSLSVSAPSQPIRYVRQGGTGDGSSWANASGDLQAQINASGTQQVWVAKGTYSRTTGGISFVLKNGVAIYGGFRGSETSLSERVGVNPVAGQVSSTTLTIPQGTVGSVIRNENNSLTATAILDGVVITDGNAVNEIGGGGGMFNSNSSPSLTNCVFSGNSASNNGGGIYNTGSNPRLTNCVIQDNSVNNLGGGIYNFGSSPSLTNCLIQNNSASNDGGGMVNNSSSTRLTNCLIQNNSANQGAGIANLSSSPTLLNCLLRGNTARGDGGALYNIQGSTPTLTNCTLTANRAGLSGVGSGAALRNNNTGTQARLTNCILWDNQEATSASITNDSGGSTSADYSLIGAGETDFTGSNNLTATSSPFVGGGDYRLSACSIAIDKGDNAANTATTDLAGNPRIVRTIDLGAYEYQGSPSQPVAITTQPASASSVQAGASVTVPVSVSGSVSSYQWYKDNLSNAVSGQTSATLSLANVQPSDGGSYSLVVSGACNSVTSTAFSLSVSNPVPTLAGLAASPSAVCVGSPVTFTASVGNVTGSYNYTLTNGSNPLTGTASGNFNQTVTASGSGNQRFTLTVSANDQSTSTATNLTVNPLPQAGLVSSGALSCAVTSVTLTASGGTSYTFANGGGGVGTPGSANTLVVSSPGTYSVTVANASGCVSTTFLTVNGTTQAPTAPSLQASATTTVDGPISVTASGCSGTLNWSLLGGSGSANGNIYTLTNPGTYTLSATCAQNGCTSPATSLTLNIQSGTFRLVAPTYDCQTGAITFRTRGGDGSLIEYFAIGVTPWTTNPNQYVDQQLRYSADAKPIQLMARQNGQQVSYSFDIRAQCPVGPDLTPLLYVTPTTISGTKPLTVVVDVVEMNGYATRGTLTLKISRDPKVTLSLPEVSSVGGRSVQNGVWRLSTAEPSYYVLTTDAVISAGDKLSVGLSGQLTPGATKGQLTISAVLLASPGELKLINNADAEKIDYFQP